MDIGFTYWDRKHRGKAKFGGMITNFVLDSFTLVPEISIRQITYGWGLWGEL